MHHHCHHRFLFLNLSIRSSFSCFVVSCYIFSSFVFKFWLFSPISWFFSIFILSFYFPNILSRITWWFTTEFMIHTTETMAQDLFIIFSFQNVSLAMALMRPIPLGPIIIFHQMCKKNLMRETNLKSFPNIITINKSNEHQ